ncbi:MAG: DUF4421 family protein [Bacteroidales bacterium]
MNKDTLALTNVKKRYIAKMDTVISLRLNLNNEHERFVLHGDDFKYDFRPNIFFGNRLSVNYRFISLGFGFALRFIPGNNGNELQGKTSAYFFRLNLFTTHWAQELQFGRTKGFYLFNTGDYSPGWKKGTDPYIQFPGLRVIAFSGTTSYKFNPNFSLKALTTQTEIQIKSCGSLIPSLSYSYYRIDNKESKATGTSSQVSHSYDAVLSLGYYYTFVISSRIYVSLGLAPGCGAVYTHLITQLPGEKILSDYVSAVFRMRERIGIGYNSRKFFAGVDVSLAQSTQERSGSAVQLNASRTYFQVFAGYRFTAPAFLKKKVLQVEKLVPLKSDPK